MKIVRSNKPYYEFYVLLRAWLFNYGFIHHTEDMIECDKIEWEKITIVSALSKINILVLGLEVHEFNMIVSKEIYKFSDERIKELDLLFWILAKLQTEYDLIEFLKKR